VLSADGLVPADTGLVVFGSLARGEWTCDSDIDWTLLVDGPAQQAHTAAAQDLQRTLAAIARTPGPTGVFGGLAFSHGLVHWIGGEQDTNRNITQRILLLLESASIPGDDRVRGRVVRAVVERYLRDDQAFYVGLDRKPVVPWFLLNDVIRYWRTMAVDLVAKRRERAGVGFATRSLKLRTSRKLIFAAGLLACLLCKLRPSEAMLAAADNEGFAAALTEHLLGLLDLTPLELLARGLHEHGARAAAAGTTLLGSYDAFLAVLDDADKRKRLDTLTPDAAADDSVFAEARTIGRRFQQGLDEFFLESDETLRRHTLRFGVF